MAVAITSISWVLVVYLTCLISVQARLAAPFQPQPAPQHKFPPIVYGSVLCDACLNNRYIFDIPIPNVTATIDCGSFQATNFTSNFGFFKFEIPEEIASSAEALAKCTVKATNDPAKVQGDLSTCNKPVEFTSQQHTSPYVPKSTTISTIFKVGPFVFQPAEALPFCTKFHTNPPSHGQQTAPAPPFPSYPHPTPAPPLPETTPSPPFKHEPAPPTVASPPPCFPHPKPTPPTYRHPPSDHGDYSFRFPPPRHA